MNTRSLLLLIILFSSRTVGAQWVQTNGPYGGIVRCLAMKDSIFLAGTPDSAIYRSSDYGKTWRTSYSGIAITSYVFPGINTLFFSQTICLAGTDNGLYSSSDDGVTWSLIGLEGLQILSIIISGNDIILGTNKEGVYQTIDSGKSWVVSLRNFAINTLIVAQDTIFAGTSDGVYFSINNGTTWNLRNLYEEVLSLAISGRNFLAGTKSNGLFLSTDNGSNWVHTSFGPLQGRGIFTFLVNGTNIFAGTANGVFFSSDSGISWKAISDGLPQFGGIQIYTISKYRNYLYIGTDKGLFSSKDSSIRWSIIGFNTRDVPSLLAYQGGVFAAAGNSDIFYSDNNGEVWTEPDSGLLYNIRALISLDTILFAFSERIIYKSSNMGRDWSTSFDGSGGIFASGFAIQNGNLYVVESGNVYVSKDTGQTWSAINSNFEIAKGPIAICDSFIFTFVYNSDLYRCPLGDTIWTLVKEGLPITSIPFLTVSEKNIFLGNDYGLLRSSDNGITWTYFGPLSDSSSYFPVQTILFSGKYIFAGTLEGILLYNDSDRTWKTFNEGLNALYITSLAVSGGYLFAGTVWNGVWRRPLSEMITSSVKSSNQPSQFHLVQNYPNPFSITTTLHFDIPERTFVSLKVYDITGREIAVLANEMLDAGSYTRIFNAEVLPSGTYVCRLEAGAYHEARTLQLLR